MDKGSSMLSSASRAPMKRGKYVTMSMAKKAAIVKLVESGRSQADVAKEFHSSKQTLSDYIKTSRRFWRRRKSPLDVVRKMTAKSTVASKVPVSGGLLKQKAETMALQMNIEGFKVSDGWLRNFKKRSDLSFKKLCGESAAVDLSAIANYRSEKLHGKASSVDLLGALSMLADAWKSMASTTLRNWFRHAGFVLNGESAALDEDSVVDQVLGSEQLIDDLRTASVEIPSDVSFSEFACVDSELKLCASLTDEEIIRQVLADDTTTLAEMRANVLARKRSMVQKKINHFFRPPAE
ncbi:hypothetical protein HPB52_015730 [Rhipicephalus sanguineus]|uniref:HTH CENPB-type domain-containing protein n=1 Tax=Rhipicephalus sanguineus TaxID=34632 RepID=A0A9D4PWW5_RHISA|nr:hypothetical protein HPB52_015730 [Rhipicephalus sanguineus]